MEKLVIEGGKPLTGEVWISGAKNAALPLIAATLLAPGVHVLHNMPDLRDTRTILLLLESLGLTWERQGSTLRIDGSGLRYSEASYDLVKTMRASILVLGPLLARLGRAKVSMPGGCAIGARPINFHLMGFEQLGVRCLLEHGYVDAQIDGRMHGGTVYFDIPSVTGTENLLMAAALAKGTTVIKNAAREPEIGNLIDMLTAMGAEIEGRDSDRLTIHGVESLTASESTIIPDRIETGTYAIAVAAAGGDAVISGCNPNHLPSLLDKLRLAGVSVSSGEDFLRISAPQGGKNRIKPVNVTTMPYPGYPTDLQAQFMALMSLSSGVCVIHETIFENRFMHVAELQRMGADIQIDGRSAMVKGLGDNLLTGAQVMATDLRASSSLVIAGLAAKGRTDISRIYHLERGYEKMVEKLTGLGATVWKEKE
ncbi:MAG: UDP-N-acetylglucosamine 1-carboxyvinyltransferase [Proteobacteria bacterium]|nr:UDP-N-acetylglucosamine 1-carboxyvinyltransferase [Pseudomonadota bacterium]MBU1140556.1 UDP-N-acetylglucosamine 1-carboxyvinyltransferase [Pseudomonadota bacterium]MBU1420442.1 UDP-N-acetylglucosamine 1-carboxyvinyltransferase [Pseudomonadota bacterium]MBU1456355.1 UDP-N-acetylglucosamine 1-carboxyvinyltransferase [Pseudomonadota bacterium]